MATDLIASIGLSCHLFSELTADDEGVKLGFCCGGHAQPDAYVADLNVEFVKRTLRVEEKLISNWINLSHFYLGGGNICNCLIDASVFDKIIYFDLLF